jgi:glutamine synthetase
VEAERRGLANLRTTPDALEVLMRPDVVKMFEDLNVLRPEEVHARVEVELEAYILKRQIEYRVLMNMARSVILPAAIKYQNGLVTNIQGVSSVLGEAAGELTAAQRSLLHSAGILVQDLHRVANELESVHDAAELHESALLKAKAYAHEVMPKLDALADICSEMERVVDDAIWPLPKFAELLFTR